MPVARPLSVAEAHILLEDNERLQARASTAEQRTAELEAKARASDVMVEQLKDDLASMAKLARDREAVLRARAEAAEAKLAKPPDEREPREAPPRPSAGPLTDAEARDRIYGTD